MHTSKNRKAPPKRSPKPAKEKKLTAKEQLFCEQYIIDHNATQAAIRAGYSVKSATEIGWENLRKPHLKAYIDAKTAEVLESIGVNQKRVLEELAKVGFADISDFVEVREEEMPIPNPFDPEAEPTLRRYKVVDVKTTASIPANKRGAIAEIKQTSDGISLKTHDKLAALDKIGRYLRMFGEGTKIEAKIPGKTPDAPAAAVITIEL